MKKLDRYEFIWKAIQVHGYKDDLREVDYQGALKKVKILCSIHGEYKISPAHYLSGSRCKRCFFEFKPYNKLITQEEFIQRVKNIWGDRYDTSLIIYKGMHSKITVICKRHGIFTIKACDFLNGHGCSKCFNERRGYNKITFEEFLKRAQDIHKFPNGEPLYDYSEVNYIDYNTEVCIICKKCGKKFWQKPNLHIGYKYGCKYCNKSKLENTIETFLIQNNLNFIEQKQFDWLKNEQNQSLDFYLPDLNIAIECQGIQHFKSVEHFGGEEALKYTMFMDKNKNELCKEHNIPILYYTNQTQIKDYFLGKLIYNKEDLLKEILKYGNNQ